MQDQQVVSLQELYEDLPCTLVELGKKTGLNEVTIARIRDGKPTRRSTVNKLLRTMSEIYGRPLTTRNVIGINVQVNKRSEEKAIGKVQGRPAKKKESAA